nr:MAG TPA: hypothetical protein [Caudoviricetes sp.]
MFRKPFHRARLQMSLRHHRRCFCRYGKTCGRSELLRNRQSLCSTSDRFMFVGHLGNITKER